MSQESLTVKRLDRYFHYVHKSDYVFEGHRHYHYELNVILSGEMEVTCDENVYRLRANDLILIPPYVFHRNRVTSESEAEMIVVQFSTDTDRGDLPRVVTMTERERAVFELFIRDTEQICRFEAGQYLTQSTTAEKLFSVFVAYTDRCNSETPVLSDGRSAIYRQAVRYMLAHLTESLRMDDVARECKVCRTTLKKVFAHYTGCGCMEFFSELKLDRAKRMLNEGASCGEIARALGYASQAHFTKRFKEHYGILPSKIKG